MNASHIWAGSAVAVGAARVSGYAAAMENHGLGRNIHVVDADFSQESGYVAAQRALGASGRLRPTALACINDLAALGAMTAADDAELPGRDHRIRQHLPRRDTTYQLGLTTVDP